MCRNQYKCEERHPMISTGKKKIGGRAAVAQVGLLVNWWLLHKLVALPERTSCCSCNELCDCISTSTFNVSSWSFLHYHSTSPVAVNSYERSRTPPVPALALLNQRTRLEREMPLASPPHVVLRMYCTYGRQCLYYAREIFPYPCGNSICISLLPPTCVPGVIGRKWGPCWDVWSKHIIMKVIERKARWKSFGKHQTNGQ
jgi:hypothetical protein